MAKNKLVFLPKWISYVMIPMIVAIWGFVTYLEYFSPKNTGELGQLGYVLVSAIFLILTIMFYMMTSGRLPAYVIKDEEVKK